MTHTIHPTARTTGLQVQTVADETLVYDQTTDQAYVLSASAAAVWRAANGKRSIQEIAQYLSRDTTTDEQTVWYALGQLQPLLQEPVAVPPTHNKLSRRQFLKRAGAVTTIAAIPVVISIVAPTPAHAQSTTGVCCLCSGLSYVPAPSCDDCTAACNTVGEFPSSCTALSNCEK